MKVQVDGFQSIQASETFTKVFQALVRDFRAPFNKLTNSSYKSHLLFKVEVDGLYCVETFETVTEVFQALICDLVAPVSY